MAGSISNSKRALEDAFSQGAAILTEMSQQRERLKATKRKVLCCAVLWGKRQEQQPLLRGRAAVGSHGC